jgi:hypothetical protein
MTTIAGLNNRVEFPSTLRAIVEGVVPISQPPEELLSVGLRSGTNKIGQVDSIPQVPTIARYSWISATINASVANNVWTNGNFEADVIGGTFINLVPQVIAPAPAEAGVTVDIRFSWASDATDITRRWHTLDTYDAPTLEDGLNLARHQQIVPIWTIPISGAAGGRPVNITLPIRGRWIRLQWRRNISIATNLELRFNAQFV